MQRLLLDMDSVLVDLMTPWLAAYNQEYNDSVTQDDISAWDMERFVKPECGPKIYQYLNAPGFFESLEPIKDGPEIVEQLHHDGYDLYIVTAPPTTNPTVTWEKLQWVRKYLPFFPEHHVIFCHVKFLVQGDLLFDDSPINLKHFPGVSVAMDYNYNQDQGDHRVQSWQEFRNLVHTLDPKR